MICISIHMERGHCPLAGLVTVTLPSGHRSGSGADTGPILKEIERIPDSYQVVHSRDNRVNLSLNRDGRVNYIYSNYNTEREVAIWLEQVSDKVLDVEYVLLVGLGLGYHLKALIEKFPHKKFFIFEPDAYLFSLSIHACDLSELLSHQNIVGLTVGTNEQILKEFIDRLTERVG
ncbi:hypothetical protein N2384_04855 [Bacillus paralicheniformis]|uniref:hypothetical protein n=1 Tax=Bacillus paralicheniformis TaxID=1648923 RepID=UPI0021A73F58|nr:hypothetical protein [Bacillus paralicheniformis]UWS62495.1 hypothetical protein N2384_04855 [Bacillus paralicheniformis]